MRVSSSRYAVIGLLIGLAAPAGAQGAGMTLEDVVGLLSNSVSPARVASQAKEYCIAFPMDSAAESRLTRANAPRDLIASLRTSCFTGGILEVVTVPTGVEVSVNQRSVGGSPYRTRVTGGTTMRVQVRRGNMAQQYDVEIPKGMRTQVKFEMLDDTLALPPERSAQQIAEDLGLMRQWVPPIPRPEAPEAPSRRGSGVRSFVVGLIAGGAGFAAASASPAPCHDKQTAAVDSYVGDKLYRAGTQVDLGVKPACAAGVGGAVGAASFLAARLWFNARSQSAIRRYQDASTAYPAELARWNAAVDRERSAWLAGNAQVNAAVASQTADRNRIRSINDGIKRQNAARALPTSSNTSITPTTPLRD